MTDEQKVKAKWPDAVVVEALSGLNESYFWIYCGDITVGSDNERLGKGETGAEAWQDAAKKLEDGAAK